MPSFPQLLRVLPNSPVLGALSSTLLLLSYGVSAAVTVNRPPTATSVTVTTEEDNKKVITLRGVDPERKMLTYSLVSQPSHGKVVLVGSNATYTPATNYFNTATTPDSFTFKVNDGTQFSAPGTVKVVVTAVNDVPTAQNVNASTVLDTAVNIALIGADVEGDSLTYIPSKSKKGGTVVVKSGNKVTYTPQKGYLGADSFTFIVKDNKKGVSKAATVSITVATKPQNLSPTANAGTDRTLNEKTLVTLDGSGSKDSDGTIATYAWKQTAGTTVVLTGATTAKLTFTAPDVAADTTLTFELTVTDNKGAIAKDTVNIAVKNIANLSPTANAGTDRTVNEQDIVTLDGSASKDSDGTIASYAWKQTAGTAVVLINEATNKLIFTAPDVTINTTLTFELTVTDNTNGIGKDTINIFVSAFTGSVVQPTPTGKINDTGISTCGDALSNKMTCPSADYPNQDAQYGRDYNQGTNNDIDGHRGFSYTKISNTGQELPVSATKWSCIKDNVTGLIWEIKPTTFNWEVGDAGLHDPDDIYTWYEPENSKNAGDAGSELSPEYNPYNIYPERGSQNTCYGYEIGRKDTYCNTTAYVKRVNAAGWCGAKDWRMPTTIELLSITSRYRFESDYTYLDPNWFPDTSVTGYYWSSTPMPGSMKFARVVGFRQFGSSGHNFKDAVESIRLVRGN